MTKSVAAAVYSELGLLGGFDKAKQEGTAFRAESSRVFQELKELGVR